MSNAKNAGVNGKNQISSRIRFEKPLRNYIGKTSECKESNCSESKQVFHSGMQKQYQSIFQTVKINAADAALFWMAEVA